MHLGEDECIEGAVAIEVAGHHAGEVRDGPALRLLVRREGAALGGRIALRPRPHLQLRAVAAAARAHVQIDGRVGVEVGKREQVAARAGQPDEVGHVIILKLLCIRR